MAYWQRRPNGTIYVYSHRDGRNKQLPRTQTKHLDGQSDTNVQYWVDNWERTYEASAIQPDSINFSNSNLTQLVNQFIDYRLTRGIDGSMLTTHKNLLLDYAIPFFLMQTPPLKDPNQWPPVAPKMLNYLIDKGLPPNSIRHLNTALRKLWIWLQEEGVVTSMTPKIMLRSPVTVKAPTPLKRVVTPAEVIKFASTKLASSDDDDDVQMGRIALCGYFFSLRTLEVFGLKRSDFWAGSLATNLEASRVFERAGLFNKLAVNIDKQRSKNGALRKPKTAYSVQFVCCFDKEAAALLISSIKDLKRDDFIISKWLPEYNIRLWRRKGIPGATIKDLRRSSLYWLGHNTGLTPVQLKNHARHSDINTTLLYCRRPKDEIDGYDPTLDLNS